MIPFGSKAKACSQRARIYSRVGCELPFHGHNCPVNNHETEVTNIIRIIRSMDT